MTRELIRDSSALHHAASADRLDVLGDFARGPVGGSWTNRTTHAVRQELERSGLDVTGGAWLGAPVHVDGLDEIVALARWIERTGAGARHRGEATVLAYAEVHGATVVMDDRRARRVAERGGLEVHGSLWVLCEAVRDGRMPVAAASGLADVLIADGARYPFERGRFTAWATSCKQLDLP